jgi:hypothetical protein
VDVTSNPIVRGGWTHLVNQVEDRLSREEQVADRLAAEFKNLPGGIMSIVSGPPLAMQGGLTALPIEVGAAIGLLIGLVVGLGTRPERRRPARA